MSLKFVTFLLNFQEICQISKKFVKFLKNFLHGGAKGVLDRYARCPHWACYGGARANPETPTGLPLFTLHPFRAKAPTKLHSPKGSFRHLAFARERKEPGRESES